MLQFLPFIALFPILVFTLVIQVDFLNGIHPFPFAKSLRYYDKKKLQQKKYLKSLK